MTARVDQIWRHPIKAHGFEALERTDVRKGEALPWDRVWAVTHEASKSTDGSWARCVNFTRGASAPHLMAICATLDVDQQCVTLSHPDLAEIVFRPDQEEDIDRFLNWITPIMPPDRAKPNGMVRAGGQAFTDSATPSLSFGNLATLRVLEQHMGQKLDTRRFRINVWAEGLAPLEELEWLGKEVNLGDVAFQVQEPIERCTSTMANPETGHRDAETLAAMNALWGHQDLGISLVAESDGKIAVGDAVRLA